MTPQPIKQPPQTLSLNDIAKELNTTIDKLTWLKLETVFELLEKRQAVIKAKKDFNMLASTFDIPTV